MLYIYSFFGPSWPFTWRNLPSPYFVSLSYQTMRYDNLTTVTLKLAFSGYDALQFGRYPMLSLKPVTPILWEENVSRNILWKAWRKNTNKMQQYRWFIVNCRCWLLTTVSTYFGHLYVHHQEKTLWRLLFEQQPSQCSHPQRSTTVPQPATSNTTSKYTPYAVTRGLFSWWWA